MNDEEQLEQLREQARRERDLALAAYQEGKVDGGFIVFVIVFLVALVLVSIWMAKS